MRLLTSLLFALAFIPSAFAQPKIEVTQFPSPGIVAKSARIVQLTDSVVVFVTGRDAQERTGADLLITSTYKWVTPYSQDEAVILHQSSTTPNTWMIFASPGKYKLLLIEFDPETGPKLSNAEVVITGTKPPPIVKPPIGDFAAITKAAKDNADKLNDPTTRASLKDAYSLTIPLMKDKTYDECKILVTTARFGVLNNRRGASDLADWNAWKQAVDVELKKVVSPGETNKYVSAIEAIILGL